jgi:hypothetical protein
MRAIRSGVACFLLIAAAAAPAAADEPWDLWEERLVGQEPLRMVFVARLPSSRACQARAAELWSSAAPAGVTRLGYTCLPTEPPPRLDPTPGAR